MGIIKYTQTQIISEFKNDFDDALEKFRKRKIQFTGVITGIEYSRCGKEVQLRAEFDSAYRQDNGVVAILLTKGIIIEKTGLISNHINSNLSLYENTKTIGTLKDNSQDVQEILILYQHQSLPSEDFLNNPLLLQLSA